MVLLATCSSLCVVHSLEDSRSYSLSLTPPHLPMLTEINALVVHARRIDDLCDVINRYTIVFLPVKTTYI